MMVEYAKMTDVASLTELRLAYLEEDHGKLSEDELEIIRRGLRLSFGRGKAYEPGFYHG